MNTYSHDGLLITGTHTTCMVDGFEREVKYRSAAKTNKRAHGANHEHHHLIDLSTLPRKAQLFAGFVS